MSIKVLHTEWSDGWGGQEIRIIEEMKAMRNIYGVESILACREGAKIADRAISEGFEVHYFPFRGNTDIKTLFALIRLIKDKNIDIVNTHSGKDTWVGGLAAKISGVAFIRTRHLSNPINPSRLNFINSLADYVMTTGESVKRDMIKNNRISEDKISSVPTGIDADRFDPNCCNRDEVRAELGVSEDTILIGIVAVLRSFKRHDIFISNATKIIQEYPNVKFLIAGDGPQKRHIDELISRYGVAEHFILTGHVDRVERVMKALDIFILTSDSKEGVPQSVIQALLMGLPVIATDVGSTADLYSGDNMILIPPKDEERLYEATKSLIEDKSLRERLSSRARASAMPFRRDEMAKKVYSIYQKLIDDV